jgi:hypothetical protein
MRTATLDKYFVSDGTEQFRPRAGGKFTERRNVVFSDMMVGTNMVVDQKVPGRNKVAGDDTTGYIAPRPNTYDPATFRGAFIPGGHAPAVLPFMYEPWYKEQLEMHRYRLRLGGDSLPTLTYERGTRTPVATPNWIPWQQTLKPAMVFAGYRGTPQ